MSSKEDLGTDPVMEAIIKGKKFVEKNLNSILSVVGVILVLFVGVNLYSQFSARKEKAAGELYATASALEEKGNRDSLLIVLNEVIDQYSGTQGAYFSAFMLGNVLFEKGSIAEAEEAYGKASKSSAKSGFIHSESLEGLGNCREAQNDYDGAISYYNRALKSENSAHRFAAIKWKLALIEKKRGNYAQVTSICDELIADTTETAVQYRQVAKNLKASVPSL